MVNAHSAVCVRVVTLWLEDQVCSKIRVSIECLDTLEGVTIVHIEPFAVDDDLFAAEPRSTGRKLLVDNLVQLA